jgi:UDP-N-acetylglucosamine:LPS N-acetylglucosamine transferase
MRLRPSWAGLKVTYVTTDPGLKDLLEQDAADMGDEIAGFHAVVDANLNAKVQLLRQLLQLVGVFRRCRPDVVITTGAAPGYFAVRLGRLFGARTIWIDSIANADELSLSGKRLKNHADVWLTQWEHLERPEGPVYLGSVI